MDWPWWAWTFVIMSVFALAAELSPERFRNSVRAEISGFFRLTIVQIVGWAAIAVAVLWIVKFLWFGVSWLWSVLPMPAWAS
jgi:hypothetical protein